MLKEDAPRGQNGLRRDFQLEDWIVQPQLNRLIRGAETVQVQPKIMAVLICLAEEPGAVVVKEQLFKTVWAETYVTEHVLARAISVLRKIFDDSPKSPRFIETIPKVGYRLIAAVSITKDEETRQPVPETEVWVRPHQPRASQTQVVAPWTSPTLLPFLVGLLGLMFFMLLVMGSGGHRHLNH